jgi:hypothetical protein
MSSSSKRKITMAKRNRENALRERRLRKQARKEARKLAAAELRAAEARTPPVADAETDPPQGAPPPA